MKQLKMVMYAVLLLLIGVACETNPEKFPINFEKMVEADNTGAFARVVNTEGAVWNVLDITNQEYTVTLEVDDAEDGGQLESIEFYLGYSDNANNQIGDIEADPSNAFRTLTADQFSEGDNGLPRITTTFTAQELADALGIDLNDVGLNASFNLRWQLNTTTGKTFGPDNSGLNITGGAFYNSPFAQNIGISLAVDQNKFVGTYEMEQTQQLGANDGGVIGPFGGDGWIFGNTQTVTVDIELDPLNKLNGRMFETNFGGYFDGGGFGTDIDDVKFVLTQTLGGTNYTTLTAPLGTGLLCAEGIQIGSPQNVGQEGTYDVNNDQTFTLVMVDDITADCGSSSVPVTFQFTKQ